LRSQPPDTWIIATAICALAFGGAYVAVNATSPPCAVPVEKTFAFMTPMVGSLNENDEPVVTSRSPLGS
jgi:hypothetical protein